MDTPRGLQPFQPGPNTALTSGKPHPSTERAKSATPASKADLSVEVRRNIYDDKGKEIKTSDDTNKKTNGEANGSAGDDATKAMQEAAKQDRKTINCYSCGIDCTRSRFHYAKGEAPTANANPTSIDVKYDLCPNCYYQSRMPSTHRSSDFTRMEEPQHTNIPDKDAPWTDTETLLLLEGLENFDTNWDEVAANVGTRTREECVMKFLQLEIQDQYMEDGPGLGSIEYRALGGREPISQFENPVMSVVSFLAQMHDPSVVAAASQRSIEQIHKDFRRELEKGMGSDASKEKDKEVEPAEAPTTTDASKPQDTKREDSMDVDQPTSTENKPTTSSSPNTTTTTPSTHPLTSLTTTALSTAAARSSLLSTHEERSATRLIAAATNLTLRKYELKLAQFAELEDIIQAERRDLDKGRQQLFLDQLRFRKRVRDVEAQLKQIALGGGGGGAAGGGVGDAGALKGLQDAVRDGVLGAGFGFVLNSAGAGAGSSRDVAESDMVGVEI